MRTADEVIKRLDLMYCPDCDLRMSPGTRHPHELVPVTVTVTRRDHRGGLASPDDMQRYWVESTLIDYDDDVLRLSCRRDGCGWNVEIDRPGLSLAELVQRAEEHTEVCR
jgi:hypothetical protein